MNAEVAGCIGLGQRPQVPRAAEHEAALPVGRVLDHLPDRAEALVQAGNEPRGPPHQVRDVGAEVTVARP